MLIANDLDQTIEAEPNKRNAAGKQTSSYRDQAFEAVVGDSEILEMPASPN